MATFDFSTYNALDPIPSEFTGATNEYELTGTALSVTSTNNDGHVIVADGLADGFVEFDASGLTGTAVLEWSRLIFRYSDSLNMWQALIRRNGTNEVKLLKMVNGVTTVLTFTTPTIPLPPTGVVVRVNYSGDDIDVLFNGVSVGTTTDSFNNTATQVGLAIGSTNARIYSMGYSSASANQVPTANAGTDQSVTTGTPVQLDGSGSSDPDVGDTLTYLWGLTVPVGSSATLSSTTAVNPTFTPDIDGTYVASLVVNDGTVDSTANTVNIVASAVQTTQVLNFDIPASFQNTPNVNYVLIPIGNNASISNGVLDTSSPTVQINVNSLGLTTGENIVIYASDINASNDATAKVMWDKSTVVEV